MFLEQTRQNTNLLTDTKSSAATEIVEIRILWLSKGIIGSSFGKKNSLQ